MSAILSITFPIYALIALGFALVRRGVFKPAAVPALGGFVINVAFPALLFDTMATRDLREILDLTYMAAYLAGSLATIAVAFAAFTALGTAPGRRAVAVMGTACPNSGFIGYPVMLLTFPTLAGQIFALNLLVENFVIIPICLAIMEASKPDRSNILRRFAGILWSVLKRPMVIALIAGLMVSLAGIEIPAVLDRVISMLAASASALALFVIGGALVGTTLRGNWVVSLQIAAGKLLLQPAMVTLALLVAAAVGLPAISPELAAALVITAALPMISIYAVFAQELGHEGMASIAQVLATSIAFVTLSALMFVLL